MRKTAKQCGKNKLKIFFPGFRDREAGLQETKHVFFKDTGARKPHGCKKKEKERNRANTFLKVLAG